MRLSLQLQTAYVHTASGQRSRIPPSGPLKQFMSNRTDSCWCPAIAHWTGRWTTIHRRRPEAVYHSLDLKFGPNLWHAASMNAQSFSAAVNLGEQQVHHDYAGAMADSTGLSTQFEQLNLRNETPEGAPVNVGVGSSEVSSSHDGPKKLRFRPKPDSQPRKSLDSTAAIRKRSYQIAKNLALRPRAMSLNCSQIRAGRFGAVCRKMFMQRRRRSFSETSSKSEDEIDEPKQPEQQPSEASSPPSDPNNVQPSCGQEANTTAADFEYSIESGEVDELAEYFGHFVNVRLKMSNMAESMYV